MKYIDVMDMDRKVAKVRNTETGEIGWATVYGTPGFGGVRVTICATRARAESTDVSDDVGSGIIHRCVSSRGLWVTV